MKSMNMVILGAGRIVGTMAGTIREVKWVNSYAVASRPKERAESFAREYGFEKTYGSHEEMVQDLEVDLVYVASPHSHRYEYIKLCPEHGEHVLCEKAFTVSEVQARKVSAMAKERNLPVTEATWVCYMPMVRTLQDVIKSGVISKVSTVTVNPYYLIDGVERIQSSALAGGALLDVGVYTLASASAVMGDEIDRIQAGCVKTEQGTDAQNSITIFYKDGRMTQPCSGTMSLDDRKGMIYGSKGYIIVENINNSESIQVYNVDRKMVAEYPCPPQISRYEYEVMACVEAVRNGWTECPQMSHEQTPEAMRQMDEVRRQLGVFYPFETEN